MNSSTSFFIFVFCLFSWLLKKYKGVVFLSGRAAYGLYRFSIPELLIGKLFSVSTKISLNRKRNFFHFTYYFIKIFFFNYYFLDSKLFSYHFWYRSTGYFFSETKLNFFFWNWSSFLKTYYYLSTGQLILYKKFFFLSGRTNRLVVSRRRVLLLKVGLSSDVILFAPIFSYFKRFKMKHSFIIFSASQALLASLTYLIRHIRYRGTYTGRGVRVYKERFILKKRPDFGKFGVKMSFY